jgi:hypothetical protein
MTVQTVITNDDFEILTDICNTENISVSALISAVVTDFLECTDKTRVASVITEAKKIKSGRPRVY